MTAEAFAAVERVLQRPGARDVTGLAGAVPGQFARLTRELAAAGRARSRVGLTTGVHIAWAPTPAAETDGPVGTAVLAAALSTLGAEPVVLTDDPCAQVTAACLEELDAGRLEVVPVSAGGRQVADRVAALRLSHLVAVERLGPAADGRVLTMRGFDVTDCTAPLHAAFALPGLVTGAVGDGGNEIGMGNVPAAVIAACVAHGERIACRVPVDALVVAGTSNWGCSGLVAGLALLVPEHRAALAALLEPAVDAQVLDAATAAGAIDGVTGRPGATVDGVPVAGYADLLADLRHLTRE
ncbi:glutamate cyclase domain-containing protein [Geodermatophilus sp. DF01_2]|uniref:glutamate cyclase domain-containing protein n=1 Tax=Geodermatophilus sp. DF01-2 TaxID=2559610 RepID=UPI00142FCDA8|nr:glutamate cyclase domain-containing protein [Geodermatophilus sp. DF01_2]